MRQSPKVLYSPCFSPIYRFKSFHIYLCHIYGWVYGSDPSTAQVTWAIYMLPKIYGGFQNQSWEAFVLINSLMTLLRGHIMIKKLVPLHFCSCYTIPALWMKIWRTFKLSSQQIEVKSKLILLLQWTICRDLSTGNIDLRLWLSRSSKDLSYPPPTLAHNVQCFRDVPGDVPIRAT